MTGKIIKWLYYKFARPQLEKYVSKTENEWDDKALLFADDIINLIASKFRDPEAIIREIDKMVAEEGLF